MFRPFCLGNRFSLAVSWSLPSPKHWYEQVSVVCKSVVWDRWKGVASVCTCCAWRSSGEYLPGSSYERERAMVLLSLVQWQISRKNLPFKKKVPKFLAESTWFRSRQPERVWVGVGLHLLRTVKYGRDKTCLLSKNCGWFLMDLPEISLET